jgi:putative MATE family efflux protein
MINALRQPAGFYRNAFALMAPIVLQNIITHMVGLTDAFMVGMLGEQFLAAMPVALVPLFIVLIFTFGVQSGTGILVSQYWGKGTLIAINRVLGVGIYVTAFVTFMAALVMSFFPHQILSLVTNDGALVVIAVPYARITAFSMALNSISMIYFACQRSMENPRLGVIVLSISAAFSIFGNWVLIFGNLGFPALGIEGAAISTLCARVLEVTIVSVHAFRNSRFRVKLRLLLRPGMVIFRDFVKYSLPVLLNEALWGFGAMLFPVIIGHMGGAQTLLAAYNISSNLERLFAVSMFACGGATAVIVGREIGAGRQARAESAAKSLTMVGFILGLFSGALLMLVRFTILEPFVFPLYDLSSEASSAATIMLTIYALTLPIRAMNFTMGLGALRGGGDVRAFMIIDVSTLYLIALPIASISGLVLRLGIAVVYSSILVEDIAKAALLFFRLRSKKWIHNVTRDL